MSLYDKKETPKLTKHRAPKYCIVITGVPGSGKSTLAKHLKNQYDMGPIIETDNFTGSSYSRKKKFLEMITNVLAVPPADLLSGLPDEKNTPSTIDHKSAIITGVFGTKPQCDSLLSALSQLNVRVEFIHLTVARETAVQRAEKRVNHPTVSPADARVIVGMHYNRAQWTYMDAFGTHHTINNDGDLSLLINAVNDVIRETQVLREQLRCSPLSPLLLRT